MSINSVTGSAIQGIQRGFQGMRRVASEIASTPATETSKPTDLSRAMVEMQQQAYQTKASVKALKSLDNALGSLFDERA